MLSIYIPQILLVPLSGWCPGESRVHSHQEVLLGRLFTHHSKNGSRLETAPRTHQEWSGDRAANSCSQLHSNKDGWWDFPAGPVVRTLRFHCRGPGFDLWLGNLEASWQGQKEMVHCGPEQNGCISLMEGPGKETRPKKLIKHDSIYIKFKSKRGNIKLHCLGMLTEGLAL